MDMLGQIYAKKGETWWTIAELLPLDLDRDELPVGLKSALWSMDQWGDKDPWAVDSLKRAWASALLPHARWPREGDFILETKKRPEGCNLWRVHSTLI